jgi:hypothetical protein
VAVLGSTILIFAALIEPLREARDFREAPAGDFYKRFGFVDDPGIR